MILNSFNEGTDDQCLTVLAICSAIHIVVGLQGYGLETVSIQI
jgi:hypothetical protein